MNFKTILNGIVSEEMTVRLNESDAPQKIIIRPMEKNDLPLLEWEGEYIHFRNVFADVYKKIEKGSAKAWVAVTPKGYMVGQVFLQLTSDRRELADGWNRAYLYSLRVRPQYHNLGIGSKIISVLETSLRKMNYSWVTLNVARNNQNAIRLYVKLGFQIVAEEPGVWSYPDHKNVWRTVTEPSWRMEKRLEEEKS
jgi:ribosomal protein S18 acetylase RimI-like enzyme